MVSLVGDSPNIVSICLLFLSKKLIIYQYFMVIGDIWYVTYRADS